MRTFSHEPTPTKRTSNNNSTNISSAAVVESEENVTKDDNTSVESKDFGDNDDDENEDDELNYQDNYDNIYDTVAPDLEYDSEGDLLAREGEYPSRDDEETTSSHEMLSRSSSTDEGLSNYVNIDYFLRKSSLGRSSSNIPGVTPSGRAFRGNGSRKKSSLGLVDTEAEDTADDAETNLSSMKSSDYDNFSSNENLIDALPQLNTNSLKSFNSSTISSTNTSSSTPSGSLRTRSLKMHLNNSSSSDLASTSYPPNMSTFTPPIRDRGQQQFTFFKEGLGDHQKQQQHAEETTTTDLGAADLPISPIPPKAGTKSVGKFGSKKSPSNSNTNSSSVEHYAYTDILDSRKSSFLF